MIRQYIEGLRGGSPKSCPTAPLQLALGVSTLRFLSPQAQRVPASQLCGSSLLAV